MMRSPRRHLSASSSTLESSHKEPCGITLPRRRDVRSCLMGVCPCSVRDSLPDKNAHPKQPCPDVPAIRQPSPRPEGQAPVPLAVVPPSCVFGSRLKRETRLKGIQMGASAMAEIPGLSPPIVSVVAFSSDEAVDADYSPIVTATEVSADGSTFPQLLSREIVPALPALWYCLHLPKTVHDLVDIPLTFMPGFQALALSLAALRNAEGLLDDAALLLGNHRPARAY